ncbi:MAG TPA: glycosyltransferase family 4 protein [Nannocystaceae bacterium]|nr:glycosyltransferase family 4 protein [Nannocystaceae bacterium]
MIASQDFPPSTGGVQTWAAALASALRVDHDVHVVAPRHQHASAFDRGFAVPVVRVPGTSDTMFVRGAPQLAATVRRLRPDLLLHAQWTSAAIAPLLRARGWCGALAIATHGRELLLELPPGIAHARRELLRRAEHVFAVSRYTAGLCRALGVANPVVVRNGVDLQRCDPARWHAPAQRFRARHGVGDRPLVVSVARLLPHKGIDTAIAAMKRVRDVVPDALYLVVGDGPDRERLASLAAGTSVRFIGRVDDDERDAAIAAADAFAMLSRDAPPAVEGFGLVALEAAALGVPVVAGDSGGVRDALLDGAIGTLVSPRDHDAAANALIALLRDRDRARMLGARARDLVATTSSWRHTAAAIVTHVRTVAQLRSDRHATFAHW